MAAFPIPSIFLAVGFVFRGAIEDRKGCLRGRCAPVCQNQLINNVVEGATNDLECVSGEHRDHYRSLGDLGYVINQLSRIRIAIGADFMGAGVEKGAECAIHVSDVLFGPFDFCPDA